MKLRLLVERIEGDQVVLITDDKLGLIWPKNKLPAHISQGQILLFEINKIEDLKSWSEAKFQEQSLISTADMINQILQAE